MGYSGVYVVAHGFRATARTMLHEINKFQPDVIESQLAHKVPDRLGNAYKRAVTLEDLKRILQEWSDYLDSLKSADFLFASPLTHESTEPHILTFNRHPKNILSQRYQ